MRVERDLSIFVGDNARAEQKENSTGKNSGVSESGSIFAGNLNVEADPIEEKRKEAQEKALKVVGDAFSGEQKLDNEIQERKDHVAELDEKIKKLIKEGGSEEAIAEARMERKGELLTIQGIKQERLKSHPMVDATKEADVIEKSASKEIVGMLMDEVKDHFDETTEELKEQEEKRAEEKEEKEEQQEEIEENREELEQLANPEKTSESENHTKTNDLTVKETKELSKDSGEVQEEVEEIVEKMKLLMEDIKGAVVDTYL